MPFKINSMKQILNIAKKHKNSIPEAMIYLEQKTGKSRDQILREVEEIIIHTKKTIEKGIVGEFSKPGLLVKKDAARLWTYYANNKPSIVSSQMKKALTYSLAIAEQNATMGKIIICPTAGSAGVVPATLLAFEGTINPKTSKRISMHDLVKAYLSASAIGFIVSKRASLAGAVLGCQAECGTAGAMAAAGLTQILSGKPEQVVNAASLALKNSLGLVCDPIGGLVQVPCIKRNAVFSGLALVCCELSMAGVKSIVPFDEIVDAMKDIGNRMPAELKETSLAGLAQTKTGKKYAKIMKQKMKKHLDKLNK